MAKYQQLKAYVDERVFENASQSITGTRMNEALTKMITDLGKGYQFEVLYLPTPLTRQVTRRLRLWRARQGVIPPLETSLLAGSSLCSFGMGLGGSR